MKIHSFLYEISFFSLIFLFCIVPSFFVFNPSEVTTFTVWQFPFQGLLLFCFAIFLYFFINRKWDFSLNAILPFSFCLGLLFFFSLIFKAISFFFKNTSVAGNISVELPVTFVQWIFCILSFLFSAFYEEILYRFYFPDALIRILQYKWNNKIIIIICEVLGLLVFSFGHIYLGWLSVLNATCAHIILRMTYKKSKTIWAGFFAHFIYNIISLILL